MTAPIASGWSESPGGACTHWKAPPCHGARRNPSLTRRPSNRAVRPTEAVFSGLQGRSSPFSADGSSVQELAPVWGWQRAPARSSLEMPKSRSSPVPAHVSNHAVAAEPSSLAAMASFSNARTSWQATLPARPASRKASRTSSAGAARSSASKASSNAVSPEWGLPVRVMAKTKPNHSAAWSAVCVDASCYTPRQSCRNDNGFQSILVTPAAPMAAMSTQSLHGFYRAGSDHRKDGQAVGW